MKKMVLILAMFIIIGFTGCRTQSENPVRKQEMYQFISMENAGINNNITLVSMTTNVKQGENGRITVRGKPGKVYTIAATYKRDGRTFVVTKSATADNEGLVSWTWDVAPGTHPGTYPVSVKCGNDKLDTVYTVE